MGASIVLASLGVSNLSEAAALRLSVSACSFELNWIKYFYK